MPFTVENRRILHRNIDESTGKTQPERILDYITEKAEERNVDDVIIKMDEFVSIEGSINIGQNKGSILDDTIRECNPMISLELGCYFAYSALRIARLLKPGAKLISVEADPDYAETSRKIIEYAGMSDKVTIEIGTANEILPTLKEKHNIDTLDFVFVDHDKTMYAHDVKLLFEKGLLRKGALILADNLLVPGSPKYVEYIKNNPKLKSEFIKAAIDQSFFGKDLDNMGKSYVLQ